MLGWQKRKRESRIISYANALLRTDSTRTLKRRYAGFVARKGGERLPRVIFLGMVEGKADSGGNGWDRMKDLEEDL